MVFITTKRIISSDMIIYDEEEIRKLVSFYIIYTCTYFPILIILLTSSTGLYSVGKYSFQSFLIVVVFAESTKYFVSHWYYVGYDYNLGKNKNCEKLHYTSFFCFFSFSKLKDCAKITFTVASMIIVYYLIAVLYGAEIFSKHEESVMFCSLLSVLTVFPICLNLGSHTFIPLLVGSRVTNQLEMLLLQNLYFTLGGAWAGSMTIPLDWDRPWQQWPIPCSLGALLGFFLSHLVMLKRSGDQKEKKYKA